MQLFRNENFRPVSQRRLAMKMPMMLLTVVLLLLTAEGFAQKVNFSGKDVPLKKVFDAIKAQTDYVFFYDVALLNQAKPVTVELKNATVEAALDQVFRDQ